MDEKEYILTEVGCLECGLTKHVAISCYEDLPTICSNCGKPLYRPAKDEVERHIQWVRENYPDQVVKYK